MLRSILIFPASRSSPPSRWRAASSASALASGSFIHVNPSDPLHYGSAGATVDHDLVHREEEDLAVGPGPKFHGSKN